MDSDDETVEEAVAGGQRGFNDSLSDDVTWTVCGFLRVFPVFLCLKPPEPLYLSAGRPVVRRSLGLYFRNQSA